MYNVPPPSPTIKEKRGISLLTWGLEICKWMDFVGEVRKEEG
jgi:hypothetical protein